MNNSITEYIKMKCPEFVDDLEEDMVDVFEVLYTLAQEREQLETLRKFMCSLGRVLPSNELIAFHTEVGNAKDDQNGINVVFSTSLHHLPIVTCKETGRQFMMNWEGIAHLAVRLGVAESDKESA